MKGPTQLALFSLMSSPDARLDDWVERHPQLCRRVRVPAAAKWEIRDKLDQANINERVLFPGLDGLSQWLARYYTPKVLRRSARTPDLTRGSRSDAGRSVRRPKRT